MMLLEGKRILITGASGGIGRACAIACATAGAVVVLMGRNRERLAETVSMLSNPSVHFSIEADLSQPDAYTAPLGGVIEKLGRLDGVVHCAGISTTLPFKLISTDKYREYMDVNFVSAMELSRFLLKPAHFSSSGGSLVFLSSVMGICGEAGKVLYSATKGALVAAARSMAIELAPKRIRVNCISPGVVVTPMSERAIYSKDEESLNKIKSLHPLGLGQPQDVASLVLFLLSDSARWITGTNIPVDGGYSAR